jgi:hypothetical protein
MIYIIKKPSYYFVYFIKGAGNTNTQAESLCNRFSMILGFNALQITMPTHPINIVNIIKNKFK